LGKKAEGSEKAAVVALSCVCCRHVCICAGVALPGGSCQSWLGIAEAMMAMRTRMRMGWVELGWGTPAPAWLLEINSHC